MKIAVGTKLLIKMEHVNHRRVAIIITRIDHQGYVYFKEYPIKEPSRLYCDTMNAIMSVSRPWMQSVNDVKFIYKRRTSAFKPR